MRDATSSTTSRRRVLLAAVLSLLMPAAVAAAPRDRSGASRDRDAQLEAALRKQTKKVVTAFCNDLERAAEWAVSRGLGSEARRLVARISELDPEYEDLDKLKTKINGAEKADGDTSSAVKTLEKRLDSASSRHAKRLYELAVKCFRAGLFTRSYDLLHEALTFAPDPRDSTQKKVMRVLGYEWDRDQKQWITDWEADQRKRHFLTAEGWFAKKDQRKFEEGLRPCLGKWVSIEEEKRIRTRNEFNPYRVESENFIVETNLGREIAWKYALLLEDFAREYYRFFIGYYDQVAGAKLLFKKSDKKKKHVVYIFPSKVEYLTHVKQRKGNDQLLRESAGYYSSRDRRSQFYWVEDMSSTIETFYHEVAHQLFAESKRTTPWESEGNNWVVEGIATYIETWKKDGKAWRPGANLRHESLQIARAALSRSAGWSLMGFVTIDNDRFHEENRGLNYAISGALCHFLLHHDDEVYREDFIRFLSAFYAGKVSNYSLVEFLDVPGASSTEEAFATLEKQFREYLAAL